jgi:hypothetical protein
MSPAMKFGNALRQPVVPLVLISLLPVGFWAAFVAGVNLSLVLVGTSALDIAMAAAVLIALMVFLIREARSDDSHLVALVWLMTYTATTFLLVFSQFYWAHRSGFNHPLTRLDAVYVTMGTLTSGTGDLNATSESVRAIQMVQELLDLLFILFAVGVVVSRIVSRDDPKAKPQACVTDTGAPVASPEGTAAPISHARPS